MHFGGMFYPTKPPRLLRKLWELADVSRAQAIMPPSCGSLEKPSVWPTWGHHLQHGFTCFWSLLKFCEESQKSSDALCLEIRGYSMTAIVC